MKNLETNGNISPKSVIINGLLHNRLKVFCKGKSLKMGGIIENLIELYLKQSKEIQIMIEKNIE
jgi:hypothetical protein